MLKPEINLGYDHETSHSSKYTESKFSKDFSPITDFKLPIVTQPLSFVGETDADSPFEKLSQVSRIYYKTTGLRYRVDAAICEISIENDNGQKLYSVHIYSAGKLFNPNHEVPVDLQLNDGILGTNQNQDFHDAIAAHQNLQRAKSPMFVFKDTLKGEQAMIVTEENGSMVARIKNNLVGSILEDKWYKYPNYTASIASDISSSFLIQSTKGCLALVWFPYFNKAEFKILSSGREIGTIGWNNFFDNTEIFCINFTQSLDVNYKVLLLVASVMVYIAYFGKTGCGSSGVRGDLCCYSHF